MITFIDPADTITGKGNEGESIYGPAFEGMSPSYLTVQMVNFHKDQVVDLILLT